LERRDWYLGSALSDDPDLATVVRQGALEPGVEQRGAQEEANAMSGETIRLLMFGALVGVLATATMDVLGSISKRLGLTVGAKGTWVGRWYLGIARGRFLHANIADAPERPGEMRVALIGHYLIGAVLAVAYLVGARWLGLAPGRILVALGYGLCTCVFPWFLMFPAIGFGFFGHRGPKGLRLFSTSVVNHLFYGFGLWWPVHLLQLG